MKHLYLAKEAKEIDQHAIRTIGIPSLVLMEKAAMTVAAVLMARHTDQTRFLCVCGTGNNGGDGVAVARILHEHGYKAAVTVIGQTDHMTQEMKSQMSIALNCEVPFLSSDAVSNGEFDVLIDGLFGIGLSRPIEGVYKKIIQDMNESGALLYSLDVPSGIHAGSGQVLGETAVRAVCTITFGVNKAGLILVPGCEYAGEVIVGDIGFPKGSVDSVNSRIYHYENEDFRKWMPKRPFHSHKGTYGKVLVIAGSETMAGAACLAAKAAYTAGAGLVKVLSTINNRDILLGYVPEILFGVREDIKEASKWADVIVVGPGLGLDDKAQELVQYVIEQTKVPVVIDGDGITLCKRVAQKLSNRFVLTPHKKEMSVLTGYSVNELQERILDLTRETAREWDCVIAQKDTRTVVSDGRECYVNVSGNQGMATGGSGDVLAGILGGVMAQKMSPFEAAKFAVYWHGLSGDWAAKEKGPHGLLASDLIESMSKVAVMMQREETK